MADPYSGRYRTAKQKLNSKSRKHFSQEEKEKYPLKSFSWFVVVDGTKLQGFEKWCPKWTLAILINDLSPNRRPGISINDAGFLEYGLSSNGRIPPYSAHQSLFAEENIFAFIIPSFPVFSSVPSPPSVVQLYLISRTSKFFLVCLHSSWPGWSNPCLS